MEYRTVIILTIIMNACHRIDTFLNEVPKDTEVKINDPTYMNCSTSLLANQVQWRHGNNYVYTGLAILEPYNARFSVEMNASTGACNLVIRSVQPSDAGTYECADDEGIGDRSSVQLVVLDGDPVCKSNVRSDGIIIGPNSCGIEPEEVKLSCSITFHGNSLPVLQWRASGDNQSITDGLVNATSINNEVTYLLTMKSTLGLNNSSYICQTTRTSDKLYNCTSSAIKMLYVFSSEVTINMTVDDEVTCFANTTQSCSYKWKWFNGDDSTTESVNQKLKPKKGGVHRCEATCSIRNESCSVQSMLATVHLAEATSGQHMMTLLILLLVPALVVIGVILYCRRKRMERRRLDEITLRREVKDQQRLLDETKRRLEAIELPRRDEEERQRSFGLIATIRTKAAMEMQKWIRGLAILDNKLSVVSDESSEVEVYELAKFSFSRRWYLKELSLPVDIVSCHRNKCFYISDGKIGCEIYKVDRSGKLIKKWSTRGKYGTLSVTYDSNVILVDLNQMKLNEYLPDGQFIRKVHLSPKEGFCPPYHAIKLANGHFMVSHGNGEDDLHRVCIVDEDGKLLKSFGGKRGSTISQTYSPLHLSVDGSGFVLVADYNNNRVLSLDSDLQFKKEILTYAHGLQYPRRILLDEFNGRIFVADGNMKNERILIFDLLRLTTYNI